METASFDPRNSCMTTSYGFVSNRSRQWHARCFTSWSEGGDLQKVQLAVAEQISGLAGSIEEPVKGYEPQSSRTMYRPLRPASLEKKSKRLPEALQINGGPYSMTRAPDPAEWR